MELLQLKYFYESARNESFAKTAEKYMVPTTSVSASVKRLEKELGCTLFDRHSNRITLNRRGERLLKSLYKIFGELNSAVDELSAARTDTREIKLLVRAMRDDITDYIIEFRKMHPDIAFRITLDFKESEFEKYDIIIDEKDVSHTRYRSFELCRTPLRLIASADNTAIRQKTRLSDLGDNYFVSWGEKSNMHKILVNACNRAGFEPKIAVMSNDMKCHEKFIESGLGIGMARLSLKGIDKNKVTILNIEDFNETYTVCAYYKKEEAYGNIKAFLDFLKKKAK